MASGAAVGRGVTRSVTGCMPTQSVGTISEQITHCVSGHPRCKPTAFPSKPAPTGLCSASGAGGDAGRYGMHTHAGRGCDQRSDNALGQWASSLQAHRVRQQAGSYRAVFSQWTGFSREASDLHLICT